VNKKQNLASTKRARIKDIKIQGSKTHESKASKISTSEVLGAEGSPSASFGAEVLKESISSRRFLFLSKLGSSELAGGDDEVEPPSSQETSASSPSWPLSASGASEAAEEGSA
jgi:hypothetical protein